MIQTETATRNTTQAFGHDYKTRVENALQCLREGKGILLVDNENRENEGDLIFAAELITTEQMALMIRHCSGIVCLCMRSDKAGQLNLPPMVQHNTSRFGTAFTVSVEARSGITTGVSAADRIQTIRTACADNAVPDDLARPGHMFPLIAADGGVLAREGHTEGSVDMMLLTGLKPQAVLCELMQDDGTMARLPAIISFAYENQFALVSVDDIVQYRKFVRDY